MKKNKNDKTDLDYRLAGLFNQTNSGYVVQPGDYEKSIQLMKSRVESITSANINPSEEFLKCIK